MNNLKSYVNWKLTHEDKVAEAEGYPLTLENCKKNKMMKQLVVYGNTSPGVGDLVTDATDANYGKYKIPVVQRGINLFDVSTYPLTLNRVIYGHNGESGSVSGYAATLNYIPCTNLQGETITVNHTSGANVGIAFYDESRTYISGARYQNATSKTVTVPDAAEYYRFSVDADYINEIQIQKGSAATSFEPYTEPITTNVFLDKPLCKVGENTDFVDFKSKKAVYCSDGGTAEEELDIKLPKLTAKTTVIEVDTSVLPSDVYGKYIKE